MQRSSSVGSMSEIDSERQNIVESHVAKPLPPLPRSWSWVCHETGLLLRSIGLGIIVTAFQGFFTKNFQEPEKVAIRRNRVTALLRTLIHAVPLGIAIFEIVLNFKGRYIGKQFDKQSYVQFAAKAHEISMQASIATILLSYIRLQISTSRGMPFGAVLGGLQFLQVSYLWSSELWSSILSKEFQLRRKVVFVSLIFVCMTIAAAAGPSSATLLIARQGIWSTRPRYLAVNATFQDIWPDRLDGEKVDRDCAMTRFGLKPKFSHCPVSDLYAVLDTYFRTSIIGLRDKELIATVLQSPGKTYLKSMVLTPCGTFQNQLCATIPQQGLLDGLEQDNLAEANRDLPSLDGYQILQKNYYQPYTTTSCVFDVVENGSDETPLQFPRIVETTSDLKKDREIISIPGLTKGQITHNVSGDSSSFHVHWIDLPQNLFGTRIPGAVIVNPQGPNGSPYNIYQCTSDAGWDSSAVMTNSLERVVKSHRMNVDSRKLIKGTNDAFGNLPMTIPVFTNTSNLHFPERRISVSKNWMNFLNPTFILGDNSTTTLISSWLSSAENQLEEWQVAGMFTVLISLALSNTGKEADWGVFNDSITAYAKCKTCLVFEIENSVYGWLYSASETTTKLAITVMLAYCVLVLGHIIYSILSGISSSAWDSTAEFVALTMNSSPTEILQNTCAGIIGLKAFKTPVRVLATTQGHLELVFGEVKDLNAQASTLVMNEKYGKLASENDNKGEELESTGPAELKKRVRCSELGARSKVKLNGRQVAVADILSMRKTQRDATTRQTMANWSKLEISV